MQQPSQADMNAHAQAQAHAQAAWAAANYGYMWNQPQWGVPASMALFVPAPHLQYASQLMPQAATPHSQACPFSPCPPMFKAGIVHTKAAERNPCMYGTCI